MTLEDKKPHILRAIEQAKSKGATALKLELESQFNRGHSYDDEVYCSYCEEGRVECRECRGEGEVVCEDPRHSDPRDTCTTCDEDGYVNCRECGGDGSYVCEDCDGDWHHTRSDGDFSTDVRCLRFLLDKLGMQNYTTEGNRYRYQESVSNWLQFAMFYRDGSVDSEITLTIRLDNPENVFKALDVMKAWDELGKAIGGNPDTRGAGMHMAFLFSENYTYPVTTNIPFVRLENFKKSMEQLMPCLFLLASPANGKNWTRGMGYRIPRVSLGESKYSAIHLTGNALEFRVFDTCYDCPEQVLDNVVVMANSLKYLNDTYNGPKVHEKVKSIKFGNDGSRTLDRLYYVDNAMDIVTDNLALLKPEYYTVKEIKKQRGFELTKTKVKNSKKEAEKKAKIAYKEYAERYDLQLDMYKEHVKWHWAREFAETQPLSKIKAMSEDDILKAVETKIKKSIEAEKAYKVKEKTYVENQITKILKGKGGSYTLRF